MDGTFTGGDTDPLMDELKAAAFEYLLLNPGSGFSDWQTGLIECYPAEVVDALGSNPGVVYPELADLWESEYLDPKTGVGQKFSEWASVFATEEATGIYYFLADACCELVKMGRRLPV